MQGFALATASMNLCISLSMSMNLIIMSIPTPATAISLNSPVYCIAAEYATDSYYVSPVDNNWSMTNRWGLSVAKPFKMIQYTVDDCGTCQTIYVMGGVYQNIFYGQPFNHNKGVVDLNGISDVKIFLRIPTQCRCLYSSLTDLADSLGGGWHPP